MGGSPSKEEDLPNKKRDVDFSKVQARVDRVVIGNLNHTKDDYVQRSIKSLFAAKTFQDVLLETGKCRQKLTELGAIKDIHVKIDVSKGEDASPNGYEVTFTGTELKKMTASINTELGHNEGSLNAEAGLPNLFGRGERVSVACSYSNVKTQDVTLKFFKPYYHTVLGDYKPDTSISLFRHSSVHPWSKYKESHLGVLADFTFYLPAEVSHSLQYEANVRELFTQGKQVPFEVRRQAGPKLCSLLRYICTLDNRDTLPFPTSGIMIKTTNEFSGLGGNVAYLSTNNHIELHMPLFAGISAELTGRCGVLQPNKNSPVVPLNYLFNLGGPLSIRGFEKAGVGPHVEGAAIGMHTYWASALHLWAPLPFSSHFGAFGNLFRLHAFYNMGNSNSFSFEAMRSAIGAGLAIRIGDRGRIEFNYCHPLDKEFGDRPQPNFQFGIGFDFL